MRSGKLISKIFIGVLTALFILTSAEGGQSAQDKQARKILEATGVKRDYFISTAKRATRSPMRLALSSSLGPIPGSIGPVIAPAPTSAQIS